MRIYADFDENDVCVGIRSVTDETAKAGGVELEHYDSGKVGMMLKNGVWSEVETDPEGLYTNEDMLDDLALALLQSQGVVTT